MLPATQARVTLSERIYYELDRMLSWNPAYRFLLLFVVSFVLIVLCSGLIVAVAPEEVNSILHGMWWSLVRVIDTGKFGDEESGSVRFVAFLCSLAGLMVVASLIGLVSSTIQEQFEELRKGKSRIIDQRHLVILGFKEEKVLAILRELKLAATNSPKTKGQTNTAAILCDLEKEDVENVISAALPDSGKLRVIVRKGSPYNPTDLAQVGVASARAIIVLNPDLKPGAEGSHVTDMAPIKTMLALRQVPGALERNHAVVELVDRRRVGVLETIEGKSRTEVVLMHETLSRLMVQTARQRGLAEVYTDLLTFEGSELYYARMPEVEGLEWSKVQARLHNGIATGFERKVIDHENPKNTCWKSFLNPEGNVKLQHQDRLLVLAECGGAFSIGPERAISIPPRVSSKSSSFQVIEPKPEFFLLCGYSRKMELVLKEFDAYVAVGSRLLLVPGISEPEFDRRTAGVCSTLRNLKVCHAAGDPTLPDTLRPLTSLDPLPSCIMCLADDTVEDAEADAKTIITVLLLCELFASVGKHRPRPRLICEILDVSSKDLLDKNIGCEFVLSTEITSRLISQVAEERGLNKVFMELFTPEGNEIYLKNASFYSLAPGEPTTWLQTQAIAATVQEVAIGYMRDGHGPVLNPPQLAKLSYGPRDRIIVIANDDHEYTLT